MEKNNLYIHNSKDLTIKKSDPLSKFLNILVHISAAITFCVLIFLIGYILVNGVPNLSADLFSIHYNSTNVSLLPATFNTLVIIVISLAIAVPIGIFSAIFLVEYAKKGDKTVALIRLMTETLSGIPSIIYGLFGMIFFVTTLGMGYSILAGSLTLSIMILPLIIRTTQEALKAVPDSLREGSFGLGAGKLRTISKVVLPSCLPAILSGVILAIGRIVGESAALIFTAGSVADFPNDLFSPGRTLAVHMYAISTEGLHMDKAYATAVVLLVIVLFINFVSTKIAKNLENGGTN